MMEMFNVHETKTHLSKLMKRTINGEDIVISHSGKPMVRLVPYEADQSLEERPIGLWDGMWKIPDNFEEPWPDEFIDLFYKDDLMPFATAGQKKSVKRL